jgi:hypothetical protein
MKRALVIAFLAVLLASFGACGAFAEEAYQKYRLSFSVGNYSPQDEIRSNADNINLFTGPQGGAIAVADPRPDSAVKNTDQISDSGRMELQVSYGILKWKWGELTLDSNLGYFKGDLGRLEVAGQYDPVDPPAVAQGEIVRYHLTYLPIGTVTAYPLQLGGTVRFRPKKSLNPYLGLSAGYMWVKVDPSEEFYQFSLNGARSFGAATKKVADNSNPEEPRWISQRGPIHQLIGAEVTAPNSFIYSLNGGMELKIAKRWHLFISGAWMFATSEVDVRMDDQHNFGKAIPEGNSTRLYPATGFPVVIPPGSGGLIDFGSGLPYTDPATGKHYVGPKDGIADSGNYYVQGGTLRYNGFNLQFGARYQF